MHTPDNGKSDVVFDIIRSYAKALNRIGKPEAIRILAARSTFEEAWRNGQSLDALKARYDFKRVGSNEPCYERGNLYQVRFIRNYRALLCFSNDGRSAWWLDVFVKNESKQNRRIETACERALRLVEKHHDQPHRP